MPAPIPPRFPAIRLPALALALALGLFLALFIATNTPARDLMAPWLAAQEVAAGHAQAIYAPAEPVFSMRPPQEWYAMAEAMGKSGAVYPYLYPPLWAFLLAPFTRLASFADFTTVVFLLNVTALVVMPQLAARLVLGAPPSPRAAFGWTLGGFAALMVTPGLVLALFQGQPQILVAGLTLLGLERTQNGRPVTGGLALGLAIALKLAPLPLALVWLVAGERRAGLTALGLAGALGLLSIAVAGWPLHLAFLAQLRVIEHSLLLSTAVASLDQIYGIFAVFPDVTIVPMLPPDLGPSDPGWAIAAQPALYSLAKRALMLGLVLGFGLALRCTGAPVRRAALWIAAIAAFAFTGPIGWFYYYLVPIAAMPLFVQRFGLRGLFAPLAALAMMSLDKSVELPASLGPLGPILGSLGILVLIGAYLHAALAPRRDARAENRAAAPQSDLRRAAT